MIYPHWSPCLFPPATRLHFFSPTDWRGSRVNMHVSYRHKSYSNHHTSFTLLVGNNEMDRSSILLSLIRLGLTSTAETLSSITCDVLGPGCGVASLALNTGRHWWWKEWNLILTVSTVTWLKRFMSSACVWIIFTNIIGLCHICGLSVTRVCDPDVVWCSLTRFQIVDTTASSKLLCSVT